VAEAVLTESLTDLNVALRWDVRFPVFYYTRARVRRRLNDRSGALVDLRSAIDLSRFTSRRGEVTRWEQRLEDWEGEPIDRVFESKG
jgi:hypothetical protein